MTGEFALELLALGLIALASGFVHSAIGFGFAIVALSFLPFVIDTRTAHVMLTMCSVPMLSMAAWSYRSGTDWNSLKPALLGAVVMVPLGVYLFSVLPLDWLVRATGAVILLMVVQSLFTSKQDVKVEASGKSALLAGAISGFLGGAVSIGGPPIATYGLRQNWKPDRFKAFLAQCLLVMTAYKVVGLLIAQEVTVQATYLAVWVTPFSIIGIQIGVGFSQRIPADRFKKIVAIVLIGVACMLLIKGAPKAEAESTIAPADYAEE